MPDPRSGDLVVKPDSKILGKCWGEIPSPRSRTPRITVSPPPLLINEVNPNGDLPGGFVEIYNPTPHAVDMAGWVVTGGDRANAFTLPDGVVIGSGEYVAVNEVTVPNEFHATDAVHLYSKFGVQADAYAWAGNVPGTAYARCPNGSGNFTNTGTPTRKAPNACP